ncbi:ankyrin-3-like [Contarinia nasturtii]|uniref:ankyrin-3-like n=1 Tax=Contarinia nasturtii TaxID=265458 RepID=UPI0012D4BCDF|nr:ankyrin-3-like [Contarinia nasturtii]
MKFILLLTFMLTTISLSVFAFVIENDNLKVSNDNDDVENGADVDNGADVTSTEENGLHFLVNFNAIDNAEKKDEFIKDDPKDLIMDAISRDDQNDTKFLLENVFNGVSGIEYKYMHIAAESCKPKVAKMLIEKGLNVNGDAGADKWGPLHVATYNDCPEVAEMLIKNGADVNAIIRIGFTPLIISAHNDRARVAEILIENGADINFKDASYNMNALEWAKSRGHKSVVDVINKYKSNSEVTTVKNEESDTEYDGYHYDYHDGFTLSYI